MKKSKEEMILEELRSLRQLGLGIYQWGITVLIAMQTAIFFIRKEVFDVLVKNGHDPKTPLPVGSYRIGTGALFIVATIFILFSLMMSVGAIDLRKQLDANASDNVINHKKAVGKHWFFLVLICFLYYLFPLSDILLRTYKIDIGILW